jgi:hypothetical protein
VEITCRVHRPRRARESPLSDWSSSIQCIRDRNRVRPAGARAVEDLLEVGCGLGAVSGREVRQAAHVERGVGGNASFVRRQRLHRFHGLGGRSLRQMDRGLGHGESR